MSESAPERLSHRFRNELIYLTDAVLAGHMVYDRVTAERLVRVMDAMSEILAAHPVDNMGRCLACRRGAGVRPWHRRAPCEVYDALNLHLAGRRTSRR